MNKLSKAKKQQLVLVLMGAAAVIAGLWYLVIQNQYTWLAGADQKTLDMRDKVGKAASLLKKAGDIESSLEADVKKLEAIEGGMASGDIYLWIINTVNRFNTERQVIISDFQREILGEVGVIARFPYKAATFPVKGTGHYHELGKFIAGFENSFPFVRVQNLEMTPASRPSGTMGEDSENLSFNFEIVALVKPPSQ